MSKEVPAIVNKVAPSDVVLSLTKILSLSLDGALPSRNAVSMLLAHIWFETGGKLTQWSVGNLAAAGITPKGEVFFWIGDFWRPPWFSDEKDPIHALMMKGEEPSAFQAFTGLDDGTTHYLSLLSKPNFHPMLIAAGSGDVTAFAEAIQSTKYTPRLDVTACAKSLKSLITTFTKQKLFDALPEGNGPAPVPPLAGALTLTSKDVHPVGADGATLFVLKLGVTGALVAVWQTILNADLGLTLDVSGAFDQATEDATKQWQTKQGFTGADVDGAVGPKTWTKFLA